jgi:hypothetical protein
MSFLRIALAVMMAASAFGSDVLPANDTLVAHEWGTFTSVAGEMGGAVRWAPLLGAPDLPCFVNHLGPVNAKFAPGLVRMETPVLYFYAPRSRAVSVHVGFPQGWITEWYPQATRVKPEASGRQWIAKLGQGEIDWESIQLSPNEDLGFPSSEGPSRYYAARNTDSVSLRINEQNEKFIFYRGIANFPVPLEPKFASEDELEIRNTGPDTIPLAIAFENRDGNVGYRLVRDLKSGVTVDALEMTGNLGELRRELADSLVKCGLHKKEALAMIETWQDSWFEEGMRVFYIVPRRFVDSQLPLKITPATAAVVRVFVGRVEVLSPWMEQTIESALADGDVPMLTKFGRFLDPFLNQIRRKNSSFVVSPGAEEYLQQAHFKIQQQFYSASCVQ